MGAGVSLFKAHYCARMFATNALTVPLSDLIQRSRTRTFDRAEQATNCSRRVGVLALRRRTTIYTRETCTLNLDRHRNGPPVRLPFRSRGRILNEFFG